MSDIIKLIELANTWQGEGPDMGRQMLIARFKTCNLHCPFCDTWIKMTSSVEGEYTMDAINKALEKTKGLMITGGEPTFGDNYDSVVKMLVEGKYQVANIETNGYQLEKLLGEELHYVRSDATIRYMYSPKVFSKKLYNQELDRIGRIIDNKFVYLKIVVDGEDLSTKLVREVSKLVGDNRGKVYLMPEGTTQEELGRSWARTVDLADELNMNLSSRMHIINNFT